MFSQRQFFATLSRFQRVLLKLIIQNYFTVCGVEEFLWNFKITHSFNNRLAIKTVVFGVLK
jgi:hypothetical protein